MTETTRRRITPALAHRVLLLRAAKHLTAIARVRRWHLADENLAALLGNDEDNLGKMRPAQIRRLAASSLARIPALTPAQILQPFPQLAAIGDTLELDILERLLLLVLVWHAHDAAWKVLAEIHGEITRDRAMAFLARIAGSTPARVRRALDPDGRLARAGLIAGCSVGTETLETMFTILEGLDEAALRHRGDWNTLLGQTFNRHRGSALRGKDFAYLEPVLGSIRQVIAGACTRRRRGIHILLHGVPGTGKTELARVLAAELGAELLEVRSRSEDDSRPSRASPGMVRLRWLVLGQRLFEGARESLFLFDEAEDLFPAHPGIFFSSSSAFHKGWINDVLESTPVPTLWTANDISWMDAAHLRRFTCILEVPVPPASVRRRLLGKALAGRRIRRAWIDRVARADSVTPAEIAGLREVLRTADVRGPEAEALLESLWREKLHGMEAAPLPRQSSAEPIPYDLDYLNTTQAGTELADCLGRAGSASALFYGLPGTGKSALARHIAERMDRPLLRKRGSELISMWIGETEKNIARAFRQAERERALLFLDEADSFLRSRESAQRSWEVTQVNELLVSMEQFDGVFIAATNLVDDLDAAAFRRFDLKIRFEPLDTEQKWRLFADLAGGSVHGQEPEYRNALAQMPALTLGDFRAALRRLRLTGTAPGAEALRAALAEEYSYKEDGKRRPVGFTGG